MFAATTNDQASLLSLATIESRFANSVIPELDLVNTGQNTIRSAIDNLEWLKSQLLRHLDADESELGSFRRQKTRLLLDKIDQECALYEQFVGANAANLTLEHIMMSVNDEDDSDDLAEASFDIPMELSDSGTSGLIVTESEGGTTSGMLTPLAAHSKAANRLSISSFASLPSVTSLPSFISQESQPTLGQRSIQISPGPHDSCRWTFLSKISSQLLDSLSNHGAMTSFAVAGGFAVGTSRAKVLLFDFNQVLQGILEDPTHAGDYGAVTALGFSTDHLHLAVGYQHGYIIVWALPKMTVLRTITPITRQDAAALVASGSVPASGRRDGHVEGSAVTSVTFVNGKWDLISADYQGSVFLHSITRVLLINTVTSTRLHGRPDGVPGSTTIYSLAGLPMTRTKYITDKFGLIAFTTPFKMAIISTKPKPKSEFRILWSHSPSKDESDSHPKHSCVAWYPALKEKDDAKPHEPTLACTFGGHLYIIRARAALIPKSGSSLSAPKPSAAEIEYDVLKEWQNPSGDEFVAIQWINSQLLGLLTATGLLIVDVYNTKTIQRSNIEHLQPYAHHHSADPQSGRTGSSYTGSFRSYKGRVFILGSNGLNAGSLIPWKDRLETLARCDKFLDAIQLAINFQTIKSSGEASAFGLPLDSSSRKATVWTYVQDVLWDWVRQGLAVDLGDAAANAKYHRGLCENSFKLCQTNGAEELIYGQLYEVFHEADRDTVFFECLEPKILNDDVPASLDPVVSKQLVEIFARQGWLDRLETLIVHLDPLTLDMDQIIMTAKDHRRYLLLGYVYTAGMNDYESPLRIMIEALSSENHDAWTTQERERTLANLFVFISYSLGGRSFPTGVPLSADNARTAHETILGFLFPNPEAEAQQRPAQANANANANTHAELISLLRWDAEGFLGALGEAFRGTTQDPDPVVEMQTKRTLQSVFAALTDIQLQKPVNVNTIVVSCFLARFYREHHEAIAASDRDLLGIFSSLLTQARTPTQAYKPESYKRQQEVALAALLEVWQPTEHPLEHYLRQYRECEFWQICEQIYQQSERYDEVVLCYLLDESRKQDTFRIIDDMMTENQRRPTLTMQQKWTIKQTVLTHFDALVEISPERSARLVHQYWPEEVEELVVKLASKPQEQYKLMKALVEFAEAQESRLEQLGVPLVRTPSRISVVVYDLYIRRLCEFAPSRLLALLQSLEAKDYTYDTALSTALAGGILDAALWLYEHHGQLDEATKLVESELEKSLATLVAFVKRGPSGSRLQDQETQARLLDRIAVTLQMGFRLCAANRQFMTEHQKENAWFSYLSRIADCQQALGRHLDGAHPITDALSKSLELVVATLSSDVSPPAILRRIMAEYSQRNFVYFHPIIKAMIQYVSYDIETFRAASSILDRDVHYLKQSSLKARSAGVAPRGSQCDLCRRSTAPPTSSSSIEQIKSEATDVALFACQHLVHLRCLPENEDVCPVCSEKDRLGIGQSEPRAIARNELTEQQVAQKYNLLVTRGLEQYLEFMNASPNIFGQQ
ncbi:Golgi CORVET complex core vacuolar protein 8-domain-containing protein [Polychytrium aggregatum]|uniref:Golgi CORVET complex core vacuolar protein 8-domain-containing protein n=1 Tax=Polychytrium aggregatum TaxID=110093 RepID=UPI0022FF166E|nr:Golgi CORVET complex core vacuolar protein 8-domain-containing protein [Polychytrium aggregatum]KAI9203432.1 Golgi CORVET complex core vacuolar protein 8-domain-containing protein [Polychytrium aggregatum]